MLKSHLIFLLAIFIHITPPAPLFADEFTEEFDWVLMRDRKGIQVHTRKVEDWVTREFQGVTTVKASLASAIALYEDNARAAEWMHRVVEFKILEQKSPNEQIIYFRQNLPWPVSDRDGVVVRTRNQDPATKAVSYGSVVIPDGYPPQNGVVRMPYIRSLWIFSPKEDGTLEIYYRLLLDVGGSVPDWLVNNRLNVNIPYYSLKKFREFLEKPEYRDAELPSGLR